VGKGTKQVKDRTKTSIGQAMAAPGGAMMDMRAGARRLRGAERGSTLVDYGILVGLVSATAIGALVLLGGKVNTAFDNAGQVLSGEVRTADGSGSVAPPPARTLEVAATGDWLWDGSRGESTNNADNSTSSLDLTIPLELGDMLSFTFEVSSEQNFDFLEMASPEGLVFKATGARTAVYNYHPKFTGDHAIKWSYVKDSSTSAGADKAFVRDLVLTPAAQMTRLDNVVVDGSWNYDGATIASIEQHRDNSSIMTTTVSASAGDVVMFDFDVSSELHNDRLTMHDGAGVRQILLSGERAARLAAPVTSSGQHLFTWNYIKDGSQDVGSDRARVLGVNVIPAARIAPLTGMVVSGDWAWDGSRGVSQNKTDSSSSQMLIDLPMKAGETLHFVYEASSEVNFDKVSAATPTGALASVSGANMASGSYTAPSDGTYRFTFGYTKDASGSTNNDEGVVRNLVLVRPE